METSINLYFFLNFSLLLLSYIPSSMSDIPPCNAQDQAVLIKIRDHFGGPNGRLSDWDNNSDCCDYNFVGCSSSSSAYGRVTAVTFSRGWGLTGTIPADFGDLPFLESFILAEDKGVTGPIPTAFGKLKKLNNFEADSNSLTGPIPKELLQLKSLKTVNLSNNKLSGQIPPVSSPLTQFNVSNNQLCGPIPSRLKKFGKTSFDHNKCLCGPPLAPCP